MKRVAFVSSLAATAIAGAGGVATAAPGELAFGESSRFPGYVLKAYQDRNGEVALAYSVEALVADLKSDDCFDERTVEDFVELDPSRIVTNAGDIAPDAGDGERAALDACDGRCASRGVPCEPLGGHDCFVVRDRIAEWVEAIDSGFVERSHDESNERAVLFRKANLAELKISHPEMAVDIRTGLRPWHPSTEGVVDWLWSVEY